jgi:probable F420-dependent oxidoreductase
VLAKEAATIDLLSDGRLEFGLGAGWMTTDYTEAGIALDPPATRVERLTEAVGIVRRLLDGETVDHDGTHYRVTGHRLTPRPVQARVPILVGGGGRRVLSAAARLADVVGLNVNLAAGRIDERAGPNATVDATERKLTWIADAAGDRYDDLELQTRVHVTAVTDDRDGVAALLAPALGISPDAALASPHALAGTVAQLVDTVVERRERFGISVVTIGVEAFEDFAPVVARLAGT